MRPAVVLTFATAPGRRDFTDRPREDLGLVRFGGWQIDPVPSTRYRDAFLIRTNVDIVLDPGQARPAWVEAGIDFRTDGVTVLDAVPISVHTAEPARDYLLDDRLNFRTAATGGHISLPAQEPALDAFGTGGPEFSWRWSAGGGVGPGHRRGWLALLVPAGTSEIDIRPWAAFASPPGSGLVPACEPIDRLVPLPRPTDPARARFPGEAALAFARRLDESWADLATLLAIPPHDRARFEHGRQARDIWRWLEVRDELPYLPDALEAIDRHDLAKLLRDLA